MRVNSVRDISLKVSGLNTAGLITESMARKAVMKKFSAMTEGRLVVVEQLNNDEIITTFGINAKDADLVARIEVNSPKTYALIVQNGALGAAEAYMQGFWSTPDLTNVVRLMAKNLEVLAEVDKGSLYLSKLLHKAYQLTHINDKDGSRKNISAHYDLGNDFFSLFLDSSMMYSSAIYPNEASTLEEAAEYKLEAICQKLDLQADDHVIEIGTGWGGFACYAASKYGCKVTTTTISKEQYNKAIERVIAQGLEDKVVVLFEDYRNLQGQYDKLVSIEMIEAVGHEFYASYFSTCSGLLKPNGKMLIQSILMSDQRYDRARKHVDFIKRYIFPGGCLPSITEISRHIESDTDMHILQIDDITYDYARTLADWRQAFLANLDQVKEQGFSDTFIRMWDYYLCYCQAGFMERSIHTAQLVFAKPGWRDPRYPDF